MGDPLVSVVVPTYNRAYCLERTLSSALSQSHRNLEIVVVDDGSTDATEELVSTISRHDSRIRFFNRPIRASPRRETQASRSAREILSHCSIPMTCGGRGKSNCSWRA
jgi:cellulose synthase/poly-beta-1,6-N-acetylglucosamine synthase-like glycosyltransferase